VNAVGSIRLNWIFLSQQENTYALDVSMGLTIPIVPSLKEVIE
jgi:hypothetical protein